MLTYFVARKGYAYYKKQKDDREYKEYVVRQSQAALVDPGARIRRLPPIPGQQDAPVSTALVSLKGVEDLESIRVQETTVTAFAPPPPERNASPAHTAIEPVAQETTTVTVFAPPPSRTSRASLKPIVAQEIPVVAVRGAKAAAPPPPPPKPVALSSTPITRPRPPPKPIALSAARIPSSHLNHDESSTEANRSKPATPLLPLRSTLGASSLQLALPSNSAPATPALPPRRALLAPSDMDLDPMRRSSTGENIGEKAHSNAETRKRYFGGSEYSVKPRAFTPPPGLPARSLQGKMK